jgi:hypothetical protein
MTLAAAVYSTPWDVYFASKRFDVFERSIIVSFLGFSRFLSGSSMLGNALITCTDATAHRGTA